jgi:preprotein translocase subunit SecG
MIYVVTGVHILVCLFLIIVVLLQSGKAADLAGAFGGMGSQTVFGPRGAATVLSKATTIAAILFMVTSLTLAILGGKQGASSGSVLEKYGRKPATTQQKTAPVAPRPLPTPATPAPAGQPPKK